MIVPYLKTKQNKTAELVHSENPMCRLEYTMLFQYSGLHERSLRVIKTASKMFHSSKPSSQVVYLHRATFFLFIICNVCNVIEP